MIIDGADNCAYDCFHADEVLFEALFPQEGQDIEFIEDFLSRTSDGQFEFEFQSMWGRPVAKTDIGGIDGILFYELIDKKRHYANKRDSDLDGIGRRNRP